MATSPQKPQLQGPFRGAASLPGARTSCALLTLLTILLAWPAPPPALPILVRPAYFALLFWFFRITGRRSDQLRGQAMRLVGFGFLVLWVSATTSAVIHFASLENRHPHLCLPAPRLRPGRPVPARHHADLVRAHAVDSAGARQPSPARRHVEHQSGELQHRREHPFGARTCASSKPTAAASSASSPPASRTTCAIR
jgi:hypothetical protein